MAARTPFIMLIRYDQPDLLLPRYYYPVRVRGSYPSLLWKRDNDSDRVKANFSRTSVRMRISFDIDDTLVCLPTVPTEQYIPWWHRWRYTEPLRRGTKALLEALVQRRCRIWIYTTSYRSPRYLKGWFRSFGIAIEGVVNQAWHEQRVGTRGPSKYPPAFGIDLHVDDSAGVAMEGEDHQFAVVVVSPEDPGWAARVLAAVDACMDLSAAAPLAARRR